MLNRFPAHAAVPTLVAGVAALVLALWLAPRLTWPRHAPPPRQVVAVSRAMERCYENVTIIHDVYWAAACATNAQEQKAALHFDAADDSADCTLPNARAAVLNAARAADEAQCAAQAGR